MPSQGLSRFPSSSQPSPLCLPLSKFSYATVSNEQIVPIPWIHLSSKNSLFVIFETSPTQLDDGRVEDRQKLKILRDPEVMEEIDLHLLSEEAHRSMKTAPASLLDAQVPQVTIIVRTPNIAIKYPMTSGQVRRFQMRFTSNEDYYEAMKILSRANVPTVEAGSFPNTRHDPVQRPPLSNVLPSDSASQLGMAERDPSSMARNLGHQMVAVPYNNPSLSISAPQSAPPNIMPPPKLLALATNIPQHPPIELSIGRFQTMQRQFNYISEAQSNVSLSPGTTLVSGNNPLGARPIERRDDIGIPSLGTRNGDSEPQTESRYFTHHVDTASSADQICELRLPPKRELPFQISKPPNNQPCAIERLSNAVAPAPGHPKDNNTMEQSTSITEQGVAAVGSKGKGKRAAKKTSITKVPAAKKPRVITTRKKPARIVAADSVVSSAGQPLNRNSSNPTARVTRSRSVLAGQIQGVEGGKSRTPQLSGIVETSQEAPGPKCPTGPTGAPLDVNDSMDPLVPALEIPETTLELNDVFPCTPADQIIHTHTPNLPAITTSVSPNKAAVVADGPAPLEENFLPTSLQGQTSISARVQGPANDRKTTPDPQTNTITNANPDLKAWAALPPAARDPALKEFLCQSLRDPAFLDLCKTMEGWWETTLFEPRLRGREVAGQ